MDKTYNSIIESLIFASDDPISINEIIHVIQEIDGDDTEMKPQDIESAVEELNNFYVNNEVSYRIVKIANGYAFATKPEYAKYVGYLSTEKNKRRLSQAALETLAIIAYKQPVTKPEIESIRGVNSDYMLNTLLEKNLVTIKGRAETIGRPLLYGTTDEFLKYFGLNKINDLPKPREIEEIMQDADFQEQKRKLMMNEIEEELENDTNMTEESDESDSAE
ncbi:MAG: SMC-Scp complex subunit ScpB [Melioribacteraceae bacterium]|nr:SMC-Scp complex subunit ScpB [Melioribacteraceae bacterium]MCF8352926.1 SMC-Scp complex subunit ScpB [Melioribacteraceae bacterium]MCF8395267.1 SMC-Scp complex subunit ScpB [Melioribacteraceae bacterium]MCF8417443.1 SMC-Scp complex subunit ScpB [Melioribacteraceae bacterium]